VGQAANIQSRAHFKCITPVHHVHISRLRLCIKQGEKHVLEWPWRKPRESVGKANDKTDSAGSRINHRSGAGCRGIPVTWTIVIGASGLRFVLGSLGFLDLPTSRTLEWSQSNLGTLFTTWPTFWFNSTRCRGFLARPGAFPLWFMYDFFGRV
jgi:hypothetical protein